MTGTADSAYIAAAVLGLAATAQAWLAARGEDTFRWTGIFTLGVAVGVLLARG